MSLAMRYSATSDVGRVRKNNQDSGFASDQLLVVADGMGGAAAGDLASAVTVQTIRRLEGTQTDDLLQALAGAVHRANDRLGEIIEDDPSVEGMGTTITAIMFDGDEMGLAHIGDSRAYLLRDGHLQQLTSDHTFVQGLVDDGRITETEARTHPHRSLLLRALDGRHDTEPDLTTIDLRPGDRLLVCSDGLCGYVEDEAIQQGLTGGTPDSAANELLQMALDAGGPDNITCVVGDIVDASAPVDSESAAAAGPMIVGAASEQPRSAMSDTASQPAVDPDTVEPTQMAGGADPEELRYAPRPPRRFRWLRRVALLLVALALLVFAGRFAYGWTQNQYFVANAGESVAIYQGIDADVPLVALSSLFDKSNLNLVELPSYWRDRVVDGIDATNLGNAQNIVRELEDAARACAKATAPPEPTPSPTLSKTPSPKQGDSPSSRPESSPRDAQRDSTGGSRPGGNQQGRDGTGASGSARGARDAPSPEPTGSASPRSSPTSEPVPDEQRCEGAAP